MGELGLKSGDTLVLSAGVQCGANCSQPMLDMAKGFLGFQGLESYLPLNDLTLDMAEDVVGSRSGSYLGGVSSIAGLFGTATRFTTGSLSLPAGAPMEASQAWTLVLWLRIERLFLNDLKCLEMLRNALRKAGWYSICGVADSDGLLEDGELEIGLASAPWREASPYLRQMGGPEAEAQAMAGGVVSIGEWTHLAVVYGGRQGIT